MNPLLGIDVGAISAKGALISEAPRLETLRGRLAGAGYHTYPLPGKPHQAILLSGYRRTRGRPLEAVRRLLDEICAAVGSQGVAGVRVTGSGGKLVGEALGIPVANEFKAIAKSFGLLGPDTVTVFEIGGETSKFLRIERDADSDSLAIVDYETNGDCAAGTGSFLDQQASRLSYAVDQIGDVVSRTTRAAQIAGRCSVFAKSDMVHAQQKGYTPAEVLKGLCAAVARNFKIAVTKSRQIVPPVALIGGVAANRAVREALRAVFDLQQDQLFVPEAYAWMGAIGAALCAQEAAEEAAAQASERLAVRSSGPTRSLPTAPPLSMDRVVLLRDRVRVFQFPRSGSKVEAYLGIDVGSVSTNLAVIDNEGNVIHEIYTRTQGRPIEVVARSLDEIERAAGDRVVIKGVGTTGSGRELIGQLVGADTINDEITAHKTGAMFVGNRLLAGRLPDTIFEVGGQDSKYISIEDGVVVDFTMNDACAAGTGSFLEERAEELGINIIDEFAREALSSRSPIRLGERCTVFMERDVNGYLQRGADKADLVAGLAYSIAQNYINRVVRGRKIGDCIFFQGGTAYNDSVAAAFSCVLDKEIIVPPHNGVVGAIGAALLAKEKITAQRGERRGTLFRGYRLDRVDYALREFTCRGCSNQCAIQEFTVEGEKTYWGDKCSDRYRKQVTVDREPVIPDLIALRHQLLFESVSQTDGAATPTVGLPRAMYTYDLLPFWHRFFTDCGLRIMLTDETNRRIVQAGLDSAVAEPCFPIIAAHGHVKELIERGVDYVFLPNVLNTEGPCELPQSHVCPWGQTLPWVVRQAPAFSGWRDRILAPSLRFGDGRDQVRSALVKMAQSLGVPRHRAARAVHAAFAAQDRFRDMLTAAGRDAIERLRRTGEKGIVLIGRPYNLHDRGINIAVARKLREYYGLNVLPMDCLPIDGISIAEINDNMYWNYGVKILAVSKLVREHPNLHIIYITNFKCGPDSFIRHFVQRASGKPFLTLQFDGHSNDAGVMTRCEAYLDSKGILRWWRAQQPSESRA